MFYFNPISYFFKSFIRLFTKKFFWVILILLLICIGWALYDKGVFAATQLSNYQLTAEQEANLGASLYNLFQCYIDNGVITGNIEDIKYLICIGDGRYSDAYLSSGQVVIFIAKPSGSISEDVGGSGIVLTNGVSRAYAKFFYESVRTFDSVPTGWLEYWSSTGRNLWLNSKYQIAYSNTGIGGAPSLTIAPAKIDPFIENESSTINNWSFDYLKINSGSQGYVYDNPITGADSYAVVNLKYTYNGITYTQQISSGYITDWSTENFIVEFPRTSLLSSVNIENGKSVDFYLEIKKDYVSDTIYSLGTYTFALTTEEQEQIQQDSDKALQGEILGAQQDTNNKLDSIENTITDTSVPPDSDFDLPTIEVNDSTANFFDTLFTGIYNAFNTNEDTSISFTIFSRTITINSADFRMLNDSRFTILRNLLESSWYFAIGYMILKDIRHIFDKIKTGNIENAVSNDIKADMV